MNPNPQMKSRIDAPEQFREMAEKGAAQSKEALEENELGDRSSGRRYAKLLFGGG